MADGSFIPSITGFAALPIPGAIFELDGTIIAVNTAVEGLLGRRAAQIIGSKAWAFAPGLEHVWAERVQIARVRGEYRDHIVIVVPDGTRSIEYVMAVREADGRSVVLAFALDISRHMHEQEATPAPADSDHKRRLEALGMVAGGIAHDFNNQLVSVLAEATAAREDPTLGEPTREGLRRIEAAANRMALLTRQLLAYAGRGRFVAELLDPDELVEGLADQLTRSVRPDAKLAIRAGAGRVVLEADRGLLRQVIVNLVANASEALPEGSGQIGVTTRVASEGTNTWWVVEVTDDGMGMDPRVAARIFDPFFTTKPDRHGLGLSAVHGIVRRLGGDIEFESHPGGGSRFAVRLPVIRGAEPKRAPSPTGQLVSPSLKGVRVLVADDEPSVRVTVRRLLERRGATVVTAVDGLEARDRLRDGTYALMLFDVMMPGLDGYALVPIARKAQPGAKVMLMSGYTERTRTDDEPDAFLEKPFASKALDAAIDALLSAGKG